MNVNDYRQKTGFQPQLSFAPDITDLPRVETFTGTGQYWRAVALYPIAPADNGGNHHVYVETRNGDRSKVRLGWTWEGRRADEVAFSVAFDKPQNEFSANIPLFNARFSVWIEDGKPSERVVNLHYKYLDAPGGGSTYGHHSWYVGFALTEVGTVPPVPTLPTPKQADTISISLLNDIEQRVSKLSADLADLRRVVALVRSGNG